MLKIKSNIKLTNTLSRDTSSIVNWEEYIEYLNDEVIIPAVKDITKKVVIPSNLFGDVTVVLDTDIPLDDSDGKFEILITMYDIREDATEDEWYNNFTKDNTLLKELERAIETYIEDLNNAIDFKHPWDESLIFNDGRLYMEISPVCPDHTPEYVKFSIDNHFIDTDEIDGNLFVQEEN